MLPNVSLFILKLLWIIFFLHCSKKNRGRCWIYFWEIFLYGGYKLTEMGKKWAGGFHTYRRKSQLNYPSVVPRVSGSCERGKRTKVGSWRLRAHRLRVLHAHLGIFNSLVPKKKKMFIGIFTVFFSFSVSFCRGSKTDHSSIVKMILEKRFWRRVSLKEGQLKNRKVYEGTIQYVFLYEYLVFFSSCTN